MQHEESAWAKMNDIYGPLVYRWCRRRGLQANDAADVMQDVLVGVSKSLSNFKRSERGGSFRRWLRSITENKIVDYFRNTKRRAEVVGGLENSIDFSPQLSPPSETGDERDERRFVVHRALKLLKEEFSPSHWNAFWRTTADGLSAVEVAQELGISPGNVRQIKFRILRRLRDELSELEDFEDTGAGETGIESKPL
ncbi:MAG: sigma-70 family RNA polymerase sigma factor [Planctomycetota bacterium]